MQFFHITKLKNSRGKLPKSREYFERACIERGISYRPIEVETTDILQEDFVDASAEDVVYRDVGGRPAREIEKLLINRVGKSLHIDKNTVFTGRGDSYDLMKNANISVIPSVTLIPRKKAECARVAEYLGGFPLVIKVYGGMEGVGVMRVDSLESFISVLDYVKKDHQAHIRVMKYIPHIQYARLVVVGGEVVAATRDVAPKGDFRANARGPRDKKTEVFTPDAGIASEAVRAVAAVGMKVGGVDVLYGDDGQTYFSEVNNPFNMAETQTLSGVDIAGKMLDLF